MATIKTLTIDQLYKECAKQIKAGNGKKKILLSGDDEGNSYHECFFGFTSTDSFGFSDPFMASTLPMNISPSKAESDYIVLG